MSVLTLPPQECGTRKEDGKYTRVHDAQVAYTADARVAIYYGCSIVGPAHLACREEMKLVSRASDYGAKRTMGKRAVSLQLEAA